MNQNGKEKKDKPFIVRYAMPGLLYGEKSKRKEDRFSFENRLNEGAPAGYELHDITQAFVVLEDGPPRPGMAIIYKKVKGKGGRPKREIPTAAVAQATP